MRLLFRLGMNAYNAARRLLWPISQPIQNSPELREISAHAATFKKDIVDHLPTIFAETLALHPRLIVELGVRDGSSRFALERAAKRADAFLVSVDVDDYGGVCNLSDRWHFVQSDDITFADAFKPWCRQWGIEPSIDVLFIDTSHLYEHTVREIDHWFPLLSARCKVMFHDTNLRRIYRRLDGTVGGGWNNHRGVIRAIEEYVGAQFNERLDFVATVNGWIVRHWAHCNGLTAMERF